MIAGFLPAPDPRIDLGIAQHGCRKRFEQEMVDAQASIALIGMAQVFPEGVDYLAGVSFT